MSIGVVGGSADARIAACGGRGAGTRGVRLRLAPVREELAVCAFGGNVRRVRMLRSAGCFLGAPLQLNVRTPLRTSVLLSVGALPSA